MFACWVQKMFELPRILDSIEKADNIGVRRMILMPWSKRLESEEQEVPDDIFVVMVRPAKETID